jgi:hypothetical protein
MKEDNSELGEARVVPERKGSTSVILHSAIMIHQKPGSFKSGWKAGRQEEQPVYELDIADARTISTSVRILVPN